MSPRVWFTADQHFDHLNIIKYCNRPFREVGEMNQAMVDRWNEVVQAQDTVYVLGDFAFRNPERFVAALNGGIVFQEGSHDKWLRKEITRSPGDIWSKHLFIPQLHEVKVGEHTIVLCHYAMRSWPKSIHGSWQLYGHSHGRLEKTRLPRQMDVGVDCHDFYPISWEQILGSLATDKDKEAVD